MSPLRQYICFIVVNSLYKSISALKNVCDFTAKQCGIGLYNGSVTDDQITASDWFYSDGDNSIWYHPKNARLFKDIREGAWAVPESQRKLLCSFFLL